MHTNPTLEPRLECYGAGYALLQPAREDVRYVLTDLGRDALAETHREKALEVIRPFGQRPTVAQVASQQGVS